MEKEKGKKRISSVVVGKSQAFVFAVKSVSPLIRLSRPLVPSAADLSCLALNFSSEVFNQSLFSLFFLYSFSSLFLLVSFDDENLTQLFDWFPFFLFTVPNLWEFFLAFLPSHFSKYAIKILIWVTRIESHRARSWSPTEYSLFAQIPRKIASLLTSVCMNTDFAAARAARHT